MLGDNEQNIIEKSRITNKNFIENLSWETCFTFFADDFFPTPSRFIRRRRSLDPTRRLVCSHRLRKYFGLRL
jgi:hypothetical protein